MTATGAAGLLLGADLGLPRRALAKQAPSVLPRPIPGGLQFLAPDDTELFHVYPPAPGFELSTITDFNGYIGTGHAIGTATARDLATGEETPLLTDLDMRFMQGLYVGVDGKHHQGTFGFF